MQRIYYMAYDSSISSQKKDLYMQFLSERRRSRVLRLRSGKAALECMLTGLFLRYGLDRTGDRSLYSRVCVDENGKPYIEGNPLYFNLSHSGDYVVLFLCDLPCGIDIQKKVPYQSKLCNRVMHEEEIRLMVDSSRKEELLTLGWSAKEAYLKYTGEGIRYAMSKLNMAQYLRQWEEEMPAVGTEGPIWTRPVRVPDISADFAGFRIAEEYFGTVCVPEKGKPETMIEVTVPELLAYFAE